MSGFFSTRSVSPHAFSTPTSKATAMPAEVGGGADNVFRAGAVAMENNILVLPRDNQGLAKRLIELHAKLFHQQQIPGRLMTSTEYFAKLVATPNARANLINELSEMLRKIAVIEFCEHRKKFGKVFRGQIDPFQLAKSGTPIDGKYALAAIHQALSLPIVVQKMEPGKELPRRDKRLMEVKAPIGSLITLQYQNGQYFPVVRDPHHYTFLKNHQFSRARLKTDDAINYPSLAEIQPEIAIEDKQLIKEYEQHIKRLSLMLKNGEITREDLRDIYIQSINETVDEPIGTEHGTQDFFDDIRTAYGEIEPVSLSTFANNNDQVSQVYVDAVARGLSVGQVKPALLDEVAEARSERFSNRAGFSSR